MLGQVAGNSEEVSYHDLPVESTKPITYFYKRKKNAHQQRCGHFIIIPVLPTVTDPSRQMLDGASTQLFEMSDYTIRMLVNSQKKVHPFPIIATNMSALDAPIKEIFKQFDMKCISELIKKETQYVPTFHIVGHGTPDGVGFLESNKQISPETFANQFHEILKANGLQVLKKRPITFDFQTCNSAYADVDDSMLFDDIATKVISDSFIGKFHAAMKKLGYLDVTVTGYRGYFCAITSRHAGEALVQDSFINPTLSIAASKSQLTIQNGIFKVSNAARQYLTFPVKSVVKTNMEILAKVLNRMSL